MHYHVFPLAKQRTEDRNNTTFLLSLLGKLHPENEMLETKSVHLRTSLDGIATVRKADEGETLGHAGFSVLGKEYSGNTTKAFEHIAQLSLLGHLGNLMSVSTVRCGSVRAALTLVTRSVAKSSLSPNLDPILSPADPLPRRAGGTYEPFLAPAAAAGEGSSPIPAATSAAPLSPMGAMVSL
jgi:hypothetical protein